MILIALVLPLLSGCGPKVASREEITRWIARTQLRHGGVPIEGYVDRSWRPLELRDYRLGPGDVIDVRILGQEALSYIDLTIPPGGIIPLPLVGSVNAQGKTAFELAREVERNLVTQLREPRALVIVRNYSRYSVSIIGSVMNPGRYPIRTDTRLLDMIMAAGGLTLGGRTGGLAPGRELFVYRRIPLPGREVISANELLRTNPENMAEVMEILDRDAPYKPISIPISNAVFSGNFEYNLRLQPDDIVYIPPAGSVIVMGRTKAPGLVTLGPSVHSLSHALTLAGGMRFGARSAVEVVREGDPGKSDETILVDARSMFDRKIPELPLRDGDMIYVRGVWWRMALEWIGGIFNPTVNAGASATYSPL